MAFKIADGYVEVHGRLDEASFRTAAKRAGERAGRDADHHFTTAFGRSVTSARSKGRIMGFFRELLTPDRSRIGALLHPLESALSVPLIAMIGASIVSLGAGAISAAISSAVLLGIGGVVLGGAAALLSKKLKPSFEYELKRILASLTRAARPLLDPFKDALHDIRVEMEGLEGQFGAIFKGAGPIIPLLVDTFKAFAEEILPTIGQIMPFIVDAFEILAQRSPEIADAITRLLKAMADEDTLTAFNYLLTGLIFTINALAGAFSFLTRSFNGDVEDFKQGKENLVNFIEDIKEVWGRIPVRKTLKFFFQPGNAIATIFRVTGLVKAIPKAWHTLMRFLGGPSSLSWSQRVIRWIKAIPKAWSTAMRFLNGSLAVSWAIRVARAIKGIPRSWRTVISVAVGGAIGAIRSVIGWLARIPRTIFVNVIQSITRSINPFSRATGGIIGTQGMATGGLSGARQVLVGEQGPELVNLPFGSKVTPAGQTKAALADAGGSGQPLIIQLRIGDRSFGEVLVDPLRGAIRTRGGDVQAVLGR